MDGGEKISKPDPVHHIVEKGALLKQHISNLVSSKLLAMHGRPPAQFHSNFKRRDDEEIDLGEKSCKRILVAGAMTMVMIAIGATLVGGILMAVTEADPGPETVTVPDVGLTCPGDIVRKTAPGRPDALVSWGSPTLHLIENDPNSTVEIVSNYEPSSWFRYGVHEVIYSVIGNTDEEGKGETCSFKVTVKDLERPKFDDCPGNIEVVTDVNGEFVIPPWSKPKATDNAGTPRLSSTYGGQPFQIGTKAVRYAATDESGNTARCSFKVTVIDGTPPVIENCPDDITITSGQPEWTMPTAKDNGQLVSFYSDRTSGDIFPVGRTMVTYTAVDDVGLTSECSFIVTLFDMEAPVFTNCPQNITTTTDKNGTYRAPTWQVPRATDNTGIADVSTIHADEEFELGRTTEITYMAKDAAGNTANCTFYVTVKDGTPPVIEDCPTNITRPTYRGTPTSQVFWPHPHASDNARITYFHSNWSPGDVFSLGVTDVVYVAEDSEGLRTECNFTVTVIDNEAPTFIFCPPNIEKNTDSAGKFDRPTWPTPRATDNSGPPIITASHRPTEFVLGERTPIRYVAMDIFGNNATCLFYVTILDNTPPVIKDCPSNIRITTDPGSPTGCGNWTTPSATDNGELIGFSSNLNPGDAFRIGRTRVMYMAVDKGGLTSRCLFSVIVVDSEPPVFTNCPSDYNLVTDAHGKFNYPIWGIVRATDNSGNEPSVSTDFRIKMFELNSRTRIEYVASDDYGNNQSCVFHVSLTDGTPPEIEQCSSDITVSTDLRSSTSRVNWSLPSATDNSKQVTLLSNIEKGQSFPLGMTVVQYTAIDPVGLTAECNFTVTVLDTEKPVFTNCPADFKRTTDPNGEFDAPVWETPSAVDNVDGRVEVTTTYQFKPFELGVKIPIMYTAIDAAGNNATCAFSVFIKDETPPVISSCPTDISLTTDPGLPTGRGNWTTPFATDNGKHVRLISNWDAGDDFQIGTTEVTYTAIDNAGLTASCQFTVTVMDDEPPVFVNCPSDYNLVTDANGKFNYPMWDLVQATDNSGKEPTITTNFRFQMFQLNSRTPIEYTTTDAYGNNESCVFYISVKDGTPPEFEECPSDISVSTDFNAPTGQVNWSIPVAADNSKQVTLLSNMEAGDDFRVGKTVVKYTAVDPAGLTCECNFTVTVIDEESPMFMNCPANFIRITGPNGEFDAPVWETPSAVDNVDGPVEVTTTYQFKPFEFGVRTPIVYTATDAAGNNGTCAFYVIISDETPPIIENCPYDITIPTDPSQPTGQANWTLPKASDNGRGVRLVSNWNPGDDFTLGRTKVSYTAIDMAGLKVKCQFFVTVIDTESPVFTPCPPNIERSTDAEGKFKYPMWPRPTAIDNSGQTPEITTSYSFMMFPLETDTPIEYFATDRAGNTAKCIFYVKIKDGTPPQITGCPGDITVSIDPRSTSGGAAWTTPSATDNGEVVSFEPNVNQSYEFPLGDTNVTYIAMDSVGLTVECQFTVTVEARCNLSLSTLGQKNNYDYKFMFPLAKPPDEDRIRFDFAVQSGGTIFVALAEDRESPHVYEIGIGSKSFIRCGVLCKPRYVTERTPGILAPSNQFHRFWITYTNNGFIQVGKGSEEPFLQWQDPSTPLDIQIIGIASYQKADWIGYLCKYKAKQMIGQL